MTAENTNFKISNAAGDLKISEREKKLRLATNLTPMYLNHLLSYIEAKVEDPIIRDMVIKKAKSYPHSALEKFFTNFDKIVNECQRKLHEIRMLELGIKSKNTSNKKEQVTTEDLIDLQKTFEEDDDIIS